MTITVSTGTPEAVEAVSSFFNAALDSLEGWRPELIEDLRAARRESVLTTGALDAIVEPYAVRSLDSVTSYGAGFIAAVDLLSDARSHLSWWQGPNRSRLALSSGAINKEHIDYSQLEWYRVPVATRGTHIAGPYVDYLCTDEYTITVSVPVEIDGEFVGVAAIDLLVDEVERRLGAILRRNTVGVTLVNSIGRVLLSSEPQLVAGDTLRGRPEFLDWHRFELAPLPLAVLIR